MDFSFVSRAWVVAVALTLPAVVGCSAIVSPDTQRLRDTLDAAATDAGHGFDAGATECTSVGATETIPCGNCGHAQRTCVAPGTWSVGACTGEGECAAGVVGNPSCGNCGTQPARCTTSCRWEPTGACTGESTACVRGTHARSGATCAPGQTREVVCSDTCAYEPVGDCMPDACPSPGVREEVACGWCGRQTRFCSGDGTWSYAPCTNEGECNPGTSRTLACERCGDHTDHCDTECRWVRFTQCPDCP